MDVDSAIALLDRVGTTLVCLDVGSAGGFHPRLRVVRSHAELIGIDADVDECTRLNASAKPGERYVGAAVGRPNEKVVLKLHRKRTTSSCYETDMARVSHFYDAERFAKEGEVAFTTRSLDEVCTTERIARVDYLKIDVEGLELAVLEGYSGTFLTAEIEVNFHPFRKDLPLVDRVIRHMHERGFMLVDLRRTFWTPTRVRDLKCQHGKGLLMHGDALFMLDPFLELNGTVLDTPAARARYLALFCLYGYSTEALMVTDALAAARIMPGDEAEAIVSLITSRAARRRPIGPRLPVRRALEIMERWVRLSVAIRSGLWITDFYQGDGELGN